MASTNAERRLWQHKDGTESSSESSLLLQPYSFSSTADSSLFLDSCECEGGCTDCNYGYYEKMFKSWSEKKEYTRKEKKLLTPLFLLFPREKSTKSLKTNKASKRPAAKSKSELLKDYCPYSSDNCGCSSGCTDCDYGLYTYTVKNKSKLKNKIKNLYVTSSNDFKPLEMSKKSRRTAKSFSSMNILRMKKAKSPKIEKALESCYPESSGSCDHKSDYIKRDFEVYTTKEGILKSEKSSARNSRKLKTRRIIRSLKLLSSKKVSKKTVVKISEKDLTKNWFPDSSNNCDCNSNCVDCSKHITTKKRKLKNRSERTRASTNLKISESSSILDELIKNKKDLEKSAKIFSKRRLPWFASCDYSESDSFFTGEDCCNKCGNIRQSRRIKI